MAIFMTRLFDVHLVYISVGIKKYTFEVSDKVT